jgi:magnesium chelatase family protein
VTLAHRGVLFLDELPEFRRAALEALRPTMESGEAVVVRARDRAVMPARPLIVAAMNPCPCGYYGHKKRVCRCSADAVRRYLGRVSGPLLDRFDLHVWLPTVAVRALCDSPIGESSEIVRERANAARARQRARLALRTRTPQLDELAAELEPEALRFLHRTLSQLELSLRAYGKVLKVSRTIADLDGSDAVRIPHVAEAVQYRVLDRDRELSNTAAGGDAVTPKENENPCP